MEIRDIITISIAEFLDVEVQKDSGNLDLGSKIDIVKKRVLKKVKLEGDQDHERSSNTSTYQYEMFFKSNPNDMIKLDGWIPIETHQIEKKERIPEYIEIGLLREI